MGARLTSKDLRTLGRSLGQQLFDQLRDSSTDTDRPRVLAQLHEELQAAVHPGGSAPGGLEAAGSVERLVRFVAHEFSADDGLLVLAGAAETVERCTRVVRGVDPLPEMERIGLPTEHYSVADRRN